MSQDSSNIEVIDHIKDEYGSNLDQFTSNVNCSSNTVEGSLTVDNHGTNSHVECSSNTVERTGTMTVDAGSNSYVNCSNNTVGSGGIITISCNGKQSADEAMARIKAKMEKRGLKF